MRIDRLIVGALLAAAMLLFAGCQVTPGTTRPPPEEPGRGVAAPATPNSASETLRDEARSQLEAGNTELASANLERAIRIDPSYAGSYFELARVRVIEGLDEQARQLLLKALDLLDSQGVHTGELLSAVNRLLEQLTVSESR